MYSPEHNQVDEPQMRAFVTGVAAGTLITVGADGVPDATFVPLLWDGDRVHAHLARAGQQWSRIVDGSSALVVIQGEHRYLTPSWYAAKAEHGRVVPTWNYSAVQLRGTVQVHDDAAWTLDMVTRLTEAHESLRAEPWSVADAPAKWTATRLRAIVGVELLMVSAEARAKWSQDKDDADRRSILDGLTGAGDERSAQHVRHGTL